MEITKEQIAKIIRATSAICSKCNELDKMLGDAMTELFAWDVQEIEDVVKEILKIGEHNDDFGNSLYELSGTLDPFVNAKDIPLDQFLNLL